MPPRRNASPTDRFGDSTRRLSLSDTTFLQKLLNIAQPPPDSPQAGSPNKDEKDVASPDPTRLLSTLASRALHSEVEYWFSLRHQAEVDRVVEVLQYCAARNYTPLKAKHLLQWLQKLQTVVEKKCTDPPVDLSQALVETLAGAEATITASAAAGAAVPVVGGGPGGRRSPSKTSRKRTPGVKRKGGDAAGEDAAAAPSEEPPQPEVTVATPTPQLSYEELLQQYVEMFVRNEVELCWRWEQVPRQPSLDGRGSPGVATTQPKRRGGSRSERLRQQQQQQQELEEEQRRQAAAAAMPPVNIYLTTEEIPPFLEKFVYRSLLQHASLYAYVAHHEQGTVQADPVRLAVELPVVVPPLQTAVTKTRTVPHAGAVMDSTSAGGAAAGGAPTGSTKLSLQRTNSARGSRNWKTAAATPMPPDWVKPPTPLPTALDLLRCEQQKEQKRFEAEHAAAEVAEALRRHVEQTEKDMELLFQKEGTQRAVVDVYDSLQQAIKARQMRILQRLEALEIAVGIKQRPESARSETPPTVVPPKPVRKGKK